MSRGTFWPGEGCRLCLWLRYSRLHLPVANECTSATGFCTVQTLVDQRVLAVLRSPSFAQQQATLDSAKVSWVHIRLALSLSLFSDPSAVLSRTGTGQEDHALGEQRAGPALWH